MPSFLLRDKTILLREGDDVAVAREPLPAGTVLADGSALEFRLGSEVPAGHKIALRLLREGEPAGSWYPPKLSKRVNYANWYTYSQTAKSREVTEMLEQALTLTTKAQRRGRNNPPETQPSGQFGAAKGWLFFRLTNLDKLTKGKSSLAPLLGKLLGVEAPEEVVVKGSSSQRVRETSYKRPLPLAPSTSGARPEVLSQSSASM